MYPSPIAVKAVSIARRQIGKPYFWGAAGPDKFDCSGLMWYAYQHAGHTWVRMNDAGEAAHGVRVLRGDILPGDLIRPHVGHIQIYAGHGKIVEAPRTGLNVREIPMWGGFLDATRIVKAVDHLIPAYPGQLRRGSHGNAVLRCQVQLTKLGYHLVGDGWFGPHTEAAVRHFQYDRNIGVDGIVGPITWGKLWA